MPLPQLRLRSLNAVPPFVNLFRNELLQLDRRTVVGIRALPKLEGTSGVTRPSFAFVCRIRLSECRALPLTPPCPTASKVTLRPRFDFRGNVGFIYELLECHDGGDSPNDGYDGIDSWTGHCI